ncbi:hypothetical protein [Mycobacterium sp.]|uniref:hypothetical protein n=1 Tax=Mycobacterium sp. TaxID=1785 RepID=UPI0011FA5B88|nr:hypothetical protein [Mycobacterium sp.]TAM64112.1 MAG: hypothetical protein EPN51_24960 [Mycobacterium sp.]
MNDQYRQELMEKYGMRCPPDPNNLEAKAILCAERNDAGNWLLCDPVRSPEMYERISDAYRSLRVIYAPDRTRAHPELYPEDQVLVWRSFWNCNTNIAEGCDYSAGLEDFPVSFGGLKMVFKCCRACKAKAVEMAEMGMNTSEVLAQAGLPPGARIDPGSALPPRP